MNAYHLDQLETLCKEYETALQRESIAKGIIAPGQRVTLVATVHGEPLIQSQRDILFLPAREYFSRNRIVEITRRERDVWRIVSAVGIIEKEYADNDIPVFTLGRFLQVCGERELSRIPNVGKLALNITKEVLARDGLELARKIPHS